MAAAEAWREGEPVRLKIWDEVGRERMKRLGDEKSTTRPYKDYTATPPQQQPPARSNIHTHTLCQYNFTAASPRVPRCQWT